MLHIHIRELRQARGMSQVELAKKLGVTKQSVSNWENDNIQPSVEMLVKLANCLCVTTDSLLDMDDRSFLEVTGLSQDEVAHIQQIIEDMKARQ